MENSKIELLLEGLNCAHCAESINEQLLKSKNIKSSNLNFISKKLIVEVHIEVNLDLALNEITKIIKSIEPDVNIINLNSNNEVGNNEDLFKEKTNNKKDLFKLILGSVIYLIGIIQTIKGFESNLLNILFFIVYIIIGYDVLYKAFRNMIKGRVFDENFLMSIATIGAVIIGEIPEAVGVMLFYKIGEYLQGLAIGKSRKSIKSLMDIRPDSANLKTCCGIEVLPSEKVNIGDIIVVKPGEKIPLDGVVISGNSMVDTSSITGESLLRTIKVGDSALSGFINKNGLLEIEVTKEFSESTASKIIELVENATSKKSKTERFISKFAKYYTPSVLILASLISFIPPIILKDNSLSDWMYRGLVFLVVSCPCALVLSIPLSYFIGIGNASKYGILIKGSDYLDILKDVDTIVFDKTGTLTKGVFNINKINAKGISEDLLLEYLSYAEANSNHPIAKSIIEYSKIDVDFNKIDKFEEIESHGVKAIYNNKYILAGNDKLMRKENIFFSPVNEIGTVVYIAINGFYSGYIVISDEIKYDVKTSLIELKSKGIKNTAMLTGDNKSIAEKIGNELGIDTVYANLLPNEKVEKLEDILSKKSKKEKVIFVGDGINDAPSLARADIGIAMGMLGSDCAIESADIVLINDEISKISKAIDISKKTNIVVWQNIIIALSVKAIIMILSAGGVANMWEAIFADVGVSLIAILNSMRVMNR